VPTSCQLAARELFGELSALDAIGGTLNDILCEYRKLSVAQSFDRLRDILFDLGGNKNTSRSYWRYS
jgi:hypothetical protein